MSDQNLTKLLKNEAKWYSFLGLFRIRRGIPRRIPLYILGCWTAMAILDDIPLLPFYWLYKMGHMGLIIGGLVNYVGVPMAFTLYALMIEKKYHRSLKSHFQINWNFFWAEKRVSGRRAVPKPAEYQFVTAITYREKPRCVQQPVMERSEVHEKEAGASRGPHPAY